ncbi:MAG: hypothetical protein Q7U08_08010 [Flavobacteriaceae bacterium]|jgi:hypothetical protein|nr:hypothetical protein [Flavobacteriaceae bacterium]
MKQTKFFFGILSLFLLVGLVFTNCQGDDEINTFTKAPISVEDAQVVADGDEVTEGITDLVDQLYMEDGMMGNRIEFTSFFPNCGTRTVKWDAAEVMKTVTIDFGDGCTLPNGNIVKGKIIIVFNKNRDLLSHTITVTYNNFYFNNKKVEGTTSIERLLANANGNPQSTVKVDLKITFADGLYIERKSERVREMIEGKDTLGIWGDNVFLITGKWTTVFRNGDIHKGEIVIPLRREMSCRFIVKGSIKVQRNERIGTIDFGNGECDNKATFTNDNGEVKEILLGKR